MNAFEELSHVTTKSLKLVELQANLSPRSNQSSIELKSDCKRVNVHRPHSAAGQWNNEEEQLVQCRRPKSAGNLNRSSKCKLWFHWQPQMIKTDINDTSKKPAMSVSQFTYSSSKLLHNLIKTSSDQITGNNTSGDDNFQSGLHCERNATFKSDLSNQLHSKNFASVDSELNFENNKKLNYCKRNENNLERLKLQPWLSEDNEKEATDFLENSHSPDKPKNFKNHHNFYDEKELNLPLCCRKRLERKLYEENKVSKLKISTLKDDWGQQKPVENCKKVIAGKNQIEILKTSRLSGMLNLQVKEIKESDKESEILECKETQKTFPKAPSLDETILNELKFRADNLENVDAEIEHFQESEESDYDPAKHKQTQEQSVRQCFSENDSTFGEIVRLLQTLEEEEEEEEEEESGNFKPLNMTSKNDFGAPEPLKNEADALNAMYSYLEEMEKGVESPRLNQPETEKEFNECSNVFESPRLEKLLNKNSVELTHEVLSLKIQIEDQKKGIKLLREALAKSKEDAKRAELEHQEALHKSTTEAEASIQRHQKFIKQLINEKKNLNETVTKLVEDLKTGEERYKKNMKALEERHSVEIKKAKEAQAIADKVKREKWMEVKTQKIKEMTVKGLEPEISRMAVRQQEEMTELRNLHRAELEAVELRAARRTSELMDQLRTELTKEKENAIARESSALRDSMEKDFECERNKMQNQCQLLKDRLRKEEQRQADREIEFQQKLMDFKKDAEKEQQRIISDFQEKLEETRRRHSVEVKKLRESFEEEKEIWKQNFKKQQAAAFYEKEVELHQQYKRERDREIEMAIEALEKESAKVQIESNTAAENKLKRLKEKFECEMKEMEASEAVVKAKLAETKALLLEKEDLIAELNSQIRQRQSDLGFLQKSCEEMRTERTNLKEIIRKEFETKFEEMRKERKTLEGEMTRQKELHAKEMAKKDQVVVEIREEMRKELARVYTRIKTAVGKKENLIEALKEEIKTSNKRCEHLEFLLDRQRRNLLL